MEKLRIGYTKEIDISTKMPLELRKRYKEFERLNAKFALTEEEQATWFDIQREFFSWAVEYVYEIEKVSCPIDWIDTTDGTVIYDKEFDRRF